MAKIVQLIGISHSPFLPVMLKNADPPPDLRQLQDRFAEMREKLASARPDVLLVIANDHMNQWFMNNMPPFVLGKAPRARGPFAHEAERYRIPSYDVEVDGGTARAVLKGGYEHGVDFAYSDEFLIDHGFTVPLTLLRPEADLPIVPLFTNVMAPPFPVSKRFYDVGLILRRIIEEMPSSARVAVLASGHMSLEIGGPKVMRGGRAGGNDPEFNDGAVDIIRRGDVARLMHHTRYERLQQAGNQTPGFLNYVMLVGVAGGSPAAVSEQVGAEPFFSWDFDEQAWS